MIPLAVSYATGNHAYKKGRLWLGSWLTDRFVQTCLSSSASAPVTSVSFSRDGQCILASTLDSKLRLIDKDTGELLNTLVHVC